MSETIFAHWLDAIRRSDSHSIQSSKAYRNFAEYDFATDALDHWACDQL